MDNLPSGYWRRCSVCKKEIPYAGRYYVCSVSTCNQKRTGLVFCSVDCWDAHLGFSRHRADAGAIEESAPARVEEVTEQRKLSGREVKANQEPVPADIPLSALSSQETGSLGNTDVLVVTSKVKKYIKDRSGMNTSASTMEALTQCVILLCDQAIENAKGAERKTVMDRDVPGILT